MALSHPDCRCSLSLIVGGQWADSRRCREPTAAIGPLVFAVKPSGTAPASGADLKNKARLCSQEGRGMGINLLNAASLIGSNKFAKPTMMGAYRGPGHEGRWSRIKVAVHYPSWGRGCKACPKASVHLNTLSQSGAIPCGKTTPCNATVIHHLASAASSVFSKRQAMVMGPTPPGTGLMAPAWPTASA